MMAEQLITIQDTETLRERMMKVWHLVNQGIKAGPVTIRLGRPSKSRDQERKYHAMIGDIAKQITFFGNKHYSVEVWKALLVDKFAQERLEQGQPLSHPGEVITSMDGRRVITIRPSTTQFRVAEANEFIEFLYAEGIDMGVKWSEPALAAYAEYREAAA